MAGSFEDKADRVLGWQKSLRLGIFWQGVALLWTTRLLAQGSQEALAESLFQDAKKLIENEDYFSACPKLAQSYEADPAGGTVLLLALCYEKIGKTASAWMMFNAALTTARADHRPDREKRAKERLAALEPRLSNLVLEVNETTQAVTGFSVGVDGVPLNLSPGRPLVFPVDPGEHRIVAVAAAHQPFDVSVSVEGGGETTRVVIPALRPVESRLPRPLPVRVIRSPEPSSGLGPSQQGGASRPATGSGIGSPYARSHSALAPLLLGGVSLGLLGIGSYFGVVALLRDHRADSLCPYPGRCEDPGAVESSHQALMSARLSDVFLGLGAVGLSASTLWYLRGRKAPAPPSTQWIMSPAAGGAWVGAQARF